MTRLARTLCTLYAAAALWLAYLTLATYAHIPLWASILTAAASLTLVTAIANTSADADDLHDLHTQLAAAVRPAADFEPRPPEHADPLVIPDQERAAFDQLTAGFEDAA